MHARKMAFGRYDFANFFCLASYAACSVAIPIVLVFLAQDLHFPLSEGGKGAGGALQLGRSIPMVAAMLFCGFAAGRFGKIRSLGAAMLCMSAGILCAACSPGYLALLAAVAAAGFGEGVVEGLATPVIQDLHEEEPGRYINFTHAFWSVGILGTVLASGALLANGVSWRWILTGCSLFALIPALLYLLPSKTERAKQYQTLSFRTVFRDAIDVTAIHRFWLFFAVMFLAGGGEFCLTFWVASFIQLDYGADAWMGGLGTAFFACGMMIGRMGTGMLVRQSRLLHLVLFCSAAGAVLGLFPPFLSNIWILFPLLFFLGVASGPFWPSIQSYCVDQLKDSDATMIYILLSCAGVPGSGFFACMMGVAGDHWGLRNSFYLVPFCYGALGLLLLLDAWILRSKRLLSA